MRCGICINAILRTVLITLDGGLWLPLQVGFTHFKMRHHRQRRPVCRLPLVLRRPGYFGVGACIGRSLFDYWVESHPASLTIEGFFKSALI